MQMSSYSSKSPQPPSISLLQYQSHGAAPKEAMQGARLANLLCANWLQHRAEL